MQSTAGAHWRQGCGQPREERPQKPHSAASTQPWGQGGGVGHHCSCARPRQLRLRLGLQGPRLPGRTTQWWARSHSKSQRQNLTHQSAMDLAGVLIYKLKPFRKSSKKPFLALSLNLSNRPLNLESFLKYSRSGSLFSWSVSSYPLSRHPEQDIWPQYIAQRIRDGYQRPQDTARSLSSAHWNDLLQLSYTYMAFAWNSLSIPAKATRPVLASSSLE